MIAGGLAVAGGFAGRGRARLMRGLSTLGAAREVLALLLPIVIDGLIGLDRMRRAPLT